MGDMNAKVRSKREGSALDLFGPGEGNNRRAK